ncbi:MAG: tetratricopeptide repeat protein [Clostridiales bacterium]|nr:tetratricopeptide repeat protein [Clostridiales bacterium]
MKKLKSIIIYFIFPVAIIALTFARLSFFLLFVIPIYFTVFTIFQYENIRTILAGYNSKKGKTNKALRHIYKAYQTKNSSIHTALAFVYMLLKAGKYDKAGEIIAEVEELEMSEYEKHQLDTNKALYLWKKNKISESLELYEKLIDDGKSTVLYGSYGYIITLDNNIAKALEVNEAAYKYNSNDKAIMDNMGLTYTLIGDYDKAFDIYEKLLARTPNFPEAYYNAAELMRQMKDYDTGVRYIKKCMTKPFNGLSTITEKDAQKKLDQLNRLQGSVR